MTAKSHNPTSANTVDSARRPTSNGRRTNRKSQRLTTYDVKGRISGEWMEMRVKAPNADEAMTRAHDRRMRVAECVEVKPKQK